MLARLPGNLLGVRDRVLLLIGFCGAFRRSELVALDAADVAITRDGLVVTITRSRPIKKAKAGRSAFLTLPSGDLPGPVVAGLVGEERHHGGAVVPANRPFR